MKLISNLGLQGRMQTLIGSTVAVGLVSVVALLSWKMSKQVGEGAAAEAHMEATVLAARIENSLGENFELTRSLAQSLEAFVKAPEQPSRAIVTSQVRELLVEHPDALGLWVVFEPNAYDGRDAEFANTPGHDASGRFIPYFHRGDGEVIAETEVSSDFETPGDGDYYLIPKANNLETVLDPYEYEVNGEMVLMTSLVVPVQDEQGRFLGAVGVDLSLNGLTGILNSHEFTDGAYASLVSAQGMVLAHPKKERLGKPMVQFDPWVEPFLGNLMNGTPISTSSHSKTLKTDVLRFGESLDLGRSGNHWTVFISVAKSVVYAPVHQAQMLALILGIVVSILVGIVVWLLARSIARPIQAVVSALGETSREIGDATGQVANSSQSLANGSSQQASALEETSASVEELTSMIKRNTDHAETASSLATDARQSAQEGSRRVSELTDAMTAIGESNQNVARIVKIIDEIAFQTNLLALNAAVEAARAGEAGAGFAVVAEEVRNLAQRSSSAARETADLITTSVSLGEKGETLSRAVSDGLEHILTHSEKLDGFVQQIADASREQSSGISQINLAMNDIERVTQTNAASAEEGAAASTELNEQMGSLVGSIAQLRKLIGGAQASDNDFAPSRTRKSGHPVTRRASAASRRFPVGV